jgi:hypothetical protein
MLSQQDGEQIFARMREEEESGWTAEDLNRVRQETRGCSKIIHLNNAGAALMPEGMYPS